jgi:hypothetical protein
MGCTCTQLWQPTRAYTRELPAMTTSLMCSGLCSLTCDRGNPGSFSRDTVELELSPEAAANPPMQPFGLCF